MIKKMLAMLAVVSCAFGAWADATHISGTDFAPLSVGEFLTGLDDSGNATESTYWYTGNTDDFDGNIITNALDEKILDFESNITNPVYRTINGCFGADSPSAFTPRAVGSGLFVDTYVAFTPYLVNENHPAPEPVTSQDKILVWVRETEVENDANITNLIVTAGYYDSVSAVSISNYVVNLSSADVSALCNGQQRLTIKAFENITTAEGIYLMGFVVYINEEPLEYTADAFAENCAVAALDATPSKYYTTTSHKLFPSLTGCGDTASDSVLSSVGYAGVGQIGEIWFDDYGTSYPSFAGDDRDFQVVVGDGVASFDYKGETYTTNSSFSVPLTTASVVISNVQYAAGWGRKDGTWYNGTTVVSNRYDSVADGDYGTFVLANGTTLTLAGFQANYLVGETEYQTLFGSLTEPNGAFAAALVAGTLKLNKDVVIDEAPGYIKIDEFQTVVLDLNGHTIKGTNSDHATIDVLADGTLTVTDSSLSKAGKVLANDTSLMAMWLVSGSTTLEDGTFEFILDEAPVSFVINGGTYLDTDYDPEDPAFYLQPYVAAGKSVDWNQDPVSSAWYATVGGSAPVTTYPVTFSTNNIAVAEYNTNIVAGATLPVDAIPAFTGGAWDLDPTNAVINAATNFNYTIAASYTLTYVSAHGAVPEGVVYTENDSDFALAAAPTADGWQFGGWLIGETVYAAEDTYVVSEHLENTTATAVWTPVTYTLTYTTEHGDAPAAVSYTVESNNFALAAAPVTSEVGIEFVGWVIGVTTNDAGATYVVADHLANTTATAAWAALVPPAKFPQSDTAGTEYAGRNGTPALPFVIRNYDDLVLLKNAVADGEITTESFEVVSNITGVADWVGIGTSSSVAFAGTLNGNGKTINVTFAAGTKYNGLFAYVNNATISNLTVNVTAGAVEGETGGAAFVGRAYGSCTFEALKATGSLGTELVPVSHNAAGICCDLEGATTGDMYFNYCTNAMAIYGSYTKMGGILAFNNGWRGNIHFNYCVNLGNLSNISTATGIDRGTGGLMGWSGQYGTISINGFTNAGTITANIRPANVIADVHIIPTVTGVNTGLASIKSCDATNAKTIPGLDWATVDGDVATFVTPVTTVESAVAYKYMREQKAGEVTGFTLAAAAASLTIDTSLATYTGTVSVASALAEDYDLRETAILNGTIYSLESKTPADPWAPSAETDEAASNKVEEIFGEAVAGKVNTFDAYTNMVAYIKSVTSETEVPDDLSSAQKTHIYQSWMLGAAVLFTEDPVISITSVAAGSEAGEWEFTVVVTTETASPTALQVAADKVKALVKVRNSLTTGSWAPPASVDAVQLLGGNAIKVTVNYGEAGSGFMKISD